jgi:hypothetical protein
MVAEAVVDNYTDVCLKIECVFVYPLNWSFSLHKLKLNLCLHAYIITKVLVAPYFSYFV